MASTLQQFAKKRKKEQTTVITARLPNSKYNLFKKYCDDLGLSINEAINLLIEAELKEVDIIIQNEADVNQVTIDDVINDSKDDEEKVNNEDELEVNTKVNNKRFTTKQYEINEELPCPICSTWWKATNYNRHVQKHVKTRKEIFTNEKYQDKIKAMIEARKQYLSDEK
jgi:hypothetical protein